MNIEFFFDNPLACKRKVGDARMGKGEEVSFHVMRMRLCYKAGRARSGRRALSEVANCGETECLVRNVRTETTPLYPF